MNSPRGEKEKHAMKKILGIVIASVIAGMAAYTLIPRPPTSAHANTMTPPYKQYEKTVAAGAIITSDVIDVTGCDDVEVFADNSLGGSTRTLTVNFYASDGPRSCGWLPLRRSRRACDGRSRSPGSQRAIRPGVVHDRPPHAESEDRSRPFSGRRGGGNGRDLLPVVPRSGETLDREIERLAGQRSPDFRGRDQMKAFFAGIGKMLLERVWLSYRSTILGLLVTVFGELLNYFYLTVPDPRIHAACALLTTIFIAWKEKKVKEGAVKLLTIAFLFCSFGALAAGGTPTARTAEAVAVNPHALEQAIAEDPGAVQPAPDPLPAVPLFGGCTKSGKLCFGPSLGIVLSAINLSTGKIEGAFSPGVGYGFTAFPGKWYSAGVSVHLVVDPGAQQASAAGVLKLINGYFRPGFSKGFIGDKSKRLLFGFGVDL
jgi:hypothetical protein